MTYNARETSTQDGRPIALYLFKWGKTEWRYTSADREVTIQEPIVVNGVTTYQPRTYAPRPISDTGMKQGGSSQNDFEISLPDDLPVVALYRGTPPSDNVKIVVRRQHIGDQDVPIYWKGQVFNVKRPQPGSATIVGKPLLATLKRTGLRLCWTRECPHFLYDPGCKVDPLDYEVTATVVAVAGNLVTVEELEQPADWFRGGFMSYEAGPDKTLERRFIEVQAGNLLTIFGLADYLAIGDTVKLYPGCTRTPTVCNGKFNNIDNYGGFDKMPGKSPFTTRIF